MKIKVDDELIYESSATDDLCADNDLLSKKEWIKNAWMGKINNCKKRLLREWQPKLMADSNVDSIPANEEDLIMMIVSRPDYENRMQRDEREEKERKIRQGNLNN